MSSTAKRRRIAVAASLLGAAAFPLFAAYVRRAKATASGHVDGPQTDERYFELDNGETRSRLVTTPDDGDICVVEGGAAEGRPVVLLHGVTLGAKVWGYQFRDLSDRYRIVALDLRGHGRSRPGSTGIGLHQLADDLRCVLDALELRGAIVVGHSMGGMALMRFCEENPEYLGERVTGLVFLATSAMTPIPPLAKTMMRRATPLLLRVNWSDRVRTSAKGGSFAARRTFGSNPSPAHIELTRQLTLACPRATAVPAGLAIVAHDARGALPNVHIPAVVMVGDRDRLTPRRNSERIAELLPNAELVTCQGAGHMLMLERPREVSEQIDALAQRLVGPTSRAGATSNRSS